MKTAEEYKSLTEAEKHFLYCAATEVAMLVSTSDKYVSAAKKTKHFHKKLTKFAKKWVQHDSAYKAFCEGKWLPSMKKPVNPLGTIWFGVYGCEWEAPTDPKWSQGNRMVLPRYFNPRDAQLGDYALLGVIHDKFLTNSNCPSILKGILPDELIELIWHDLITGVGFELSYTHRVMLDKNKIKGCFSHIKSDIEMLSKEKEAATASGLGSKGITPPITRDSVSTDQQKSADAKQEITDESQTQIEGGQGKTVDINENLYIKKGKTNWEFGFNSMPAKVEFKPNQELKGLALVEFLLLHPNTKYTPLELLQETEQWGKEETEPGKIYTDKEIEKIKGAINGLKDRLKLSDNAEEKERFEQEIKKANEVLYKARNCKGKSRKISDRYRLSVSRKINTVLIKIAPRSTQLYNHLDQFLTRGEICCYKPDKEIIWEITSENS